MRLFLAATMLMAPISAVVQLGDLSSVHQRPESYVVYAAEQQTVTAGKRDVLELTFHVAPGFHVNSHMPKSDLLLPTRFELVPNDGVMVAKSEYPAGRTYSFSFDPGNKLDVYSGAFTVKLLVVALPGPHVMDGTLRYQACDHAACYPPKSLPVKLMFTAK